MTFRSQAAAGPRPDRARILSAEDPNTHRRTRMHEARLSPVIRQSAATKIKG
jgi:hypothetical protein